jgi:hypothetical protein
MRKGNTIMPQTVTSLEGFTRKIRRIAPTTDEVLLYRGHSDRKKFRLLPSVLRESKFRDAEETILRELLASHPSEFANDASTVDRLVRVQHYSLPTRLLDATWNPLVALYFAAKGHPDTTGEVIVFRIRKERVKYFDSDTVSCVANLAQLKIVDKGQIDFGLALADFNRQEPVKRLLQFVGAEKPQFRPIIVPEDLKSVLCVKPKQNNPRILAQSGAFLLFGMTDDLDSASVRGISVERIQINAKKKPDILKELDSVAINESTMFPEIEKAALYIREKL